MCTIMEMKDKHFGLLPYKESGEMGIKSSRSVENHLYQTTEDHIVLKLSNNNQDIWPLIQIVRISLEEEVR